MPANDENTRNRAGGGLRVLVVGGASRSAQAFRIHATSQPDFLLTSLVRRPIPALGSETIHQIADYFAPPETVLNGSDAVINFAGITHGPATGEMQRVNVDGPVRLAAAAKRAGVRHFVHLSSFHVYGYAEEISNETLENPVTDYARSKQAADRALGALAGDDFAVTLLRLPVHYGRGAGANLRKLAELMKKLGWFPMPYKAARRSALHVDNLAVVLAEIVRRRLGGIRLAADPEPFGIDILAEIVAQQSHKPIRLIRLPQATFVPLRLLSKSLYCRLYRPNLARPEHCIATAAPFPVALRDGLTELVR